MTYQIATFEGNDQNIFKDRNEFPESLLKQLNDVYEYINFRNSTHATFNKLLRTDIRDYPENAVRKSLLNLIVHRDYSYSASANINLYADRIEFISLGGLLPGVELEDVMMGLSVYRNVKLANVFYRLRVIETYGTGIQKIMNAYQDNKIKPHIEVTNNAFKITLPNINNLDSNNIQIKNDKNISKQNNILAKEQKILEYLQKKQVISREETEQLFNISTATAFILLKRMSEDGYIEQHKEGKNTWYSLLSKDN